VTGPTKPFVYRKPFGAMGRADDVAHDLSGRSMYQAANRREWKLAATAVGVIDSGRGRSVGLTAKRGRRW
jgi:hypothetical protein